MWAQICFSQKEIHSLEKSLKVQRFASSIQRLPLLSKYFIAAESTKETNKAFGHVGNINQTLYHIMHEISIN